MSTNKRYRQLDDKVFSIASTLFGFGATEEKKQAEESIATNSATQVATKIATKLQPELLDNRIMAVYPAIIENAFAETMDNYRKYIATYNTKTQTENDLIEKHNRAVNRFLKENTLNEVQKQFRQLFILNNLALKPREYNAKTEDFCKDYGFIVEKRKIQTVKYATEIVFSNLLHLYNSQLMKRNEQYMKLGVTSARPIQEFKVNSYLVTELKRNDVHSLDLCTKTVRNHRQRLEEAGVFVDYHFAGQNRPVELHINPEILTVLDIKTTKLKNSENQHFNLRFENILPDNNESTRTIYKNEYQKNENVNNSQDIRSSGGALTPSYLFFTGTHASKEENSTQGAAAESVKVPETLSEKLRNLTIHPQELAINLAAKEYNNYKPVDIRHIYKEAYSGTLTNDEFREFALQDFFKMISKTWKFSNAYAGSWKKAINQYYQHKWLTPNGETCNKTIIADGIQQMRWRASWAQKWFFKNDFRPLFPSDYFDMTRKTAKEVGFEYTYLKWTEHLRSIEKYGQLKKKQEADAVRRKQNINHTKKCETQLRRFFKNQITMHHLFDYVEKNLPPEFLEKLPRMIELKALKANEKTVNAEDYAKYDVSEF